MVLDATLGGFEQASFSTDERLEQADLCMVFQFCNVDLRGVPFDKMPRMRGVRMACDRLRAIVDSRPERQG